MALHLNFVVKGELKDVWKRSQMVDFSRGHYMQTS